MRYIPSMSNRLAQAILEVDRAKFVPEELRHFYDPYQNNIIPVEDGSSISQPSVVVWMLHELDVQEGQDILEIGTGTGYQAALLSVITGENGHVDTVELKLHLAVQAKKTLQQLQYNNVAVYKRDGTLRPHLSIAKSYDRIIVTAGAKEIPQALINQLKVGGKIVAPIGEDILNLQLVVGTKQENGDLAIEVKGEGFSFVPLVEENLNK